MVWWTFRRLHAVSSYGMGYLSRERVVAEDKSSRLLTLGSDVGGMNIFLFPIMRRVF